MKCELFFYLGEIVVILLFNSLLIYWEKEVCDWLVSQNGTEFSRYSSSNNCMVGGWEAHT